MKKSKESGESKKKGKSNELVDTRDVIKRNGFRKPRVAGVYVRNEGDAKIVYSYAAYGATNEDIATALGMERKTLVKHYPDELDAGRAVSKNTIAQRIYQIAVGREAIIDRETGEEIAPAIKPNLSALIFLAKTRLGWKETQVVEQNVEVKSAVQIYLPDNGMEIQAQPKEN